MTNSFKSYGKHCSVYFNENNNLYFLLKQQKSGKMSTKTHEYGSDEEKCRD